MADTQIASSRMAGLLIAGGFLPFFGLGLAHIVKPDFGLDPGWVERALLGYGAVILSFLGGIRWGVALVREQRDTPQQLALSVLPSLVGWLALLVGGSVGLGLLIAGFAGQYLWDREAANQGNLPIWFGRQRLMISSAVIVMLLAALIFG